MARVTVEDCVLVVPNRFELCLVAIDRAKSILSGSITSLNKKEKPSVIALREIADHNVDIENVRNNIVRNIKNRNIVEYSDLINNAGPSIIEEENINKGNVLKDNTFLEDDVEVDD